MDLSQPLLFPKFVAGLASSITLLEEHSRSRRYVFLTRDSRQCSIRTEEETKIGGGGDGGVGAGDRFSHKIEMLLSRIR